MQFEVEELRVIRARYGEPPSTTSAGYIGGTYGVCLTFSSFLVSIHFLSISLRQRID